MSSHSLPPELLQRIDTVCDAFEQAWRTGKAPRIETYLETNSESHGELLRELLARELELRRAAGETIDAAEYERRFEGYLDLVRTLLFESDEIGPAARVEPQSTSHGQAGEPRGELDRTDASTIPCLFEIGPPRRKGRDAAELPERIGGFRPVRRLGQGNFDVFLARDERTGEEFALKVARPDDPFSRRRLTSLAAEAQRMAALDHPDIVKVHEFVIPTGPQGNDSTGADGFIVLEYVDGQTLEAVLEAEGRLPPSTLIPIVATVADAVHHAHLAGIVHRDLKPSNILIDARGHARVCDFGLAVKQDWMRVNPNQVAGTLHYMAPEQVRGQTSKLDGRTDVWALGVILYRGLTGQLPFWGTNASECFDEILNREPRPPRQITDEIPKQLERICLRCLSKPIGDRYLTAADLADDLRRAASAAGVVASVESAAPVSPKGMRAFGGEDSQAFLTLVPGPLGPDGLPETIRFWKSRIETDAGPDALRVGVIHGPPGGGKTSFVRAGLLPRLDRLEVRTIELTCNSTDTEARLLHEIHRTFPGIPRERGLCDTLAAIQDDAQGRSEQKVLLVLDQFERWRYGRAFDPDSELTAALRGCDGRSLSALLVVRDTCWMTVSRMFHTLQLPLVEGENALAVELLDSLHAREVLKRFGRGLGRVSEGTESDSFLDQVVADLAGPDGRTAPIRISMFVEVMRHRHWSIETLRELGGIEGIESKFLDLAIDSPVANPTCHAHRAAARSVLNLLLRASDGLDPIPRPERLLREAAGFADGDTRFSDVIQALDHDLRLITPADWRADSREAAESAYPPTERHYQLAHGFLSRPLRRWLSAGPGPRDRNRAELRLEAITARWLAKPSSQRLPTLREYASIRLGTRPADWSDAEYRLMGTAMWHHARRVFLVVSLVAVLVVLFIWRSWR